MEIYFLRGIRVTCRLAVLSGLHFAYLFAEEVSDSGLAVIREPRQRVDIYARL